jgi:hypothetical protein
MDRRISLHGVVVGTDRRPPDVLLGGCSVGSLGRRKRCTAVQSASLPGGHFFVDQFPRETARILIDFLTTAGDGG